jgi:hypothetical protein
MSREALSHSLLHTASAAMNHEPTPSSHALSCAELPPTLYRSEAFVEDLLEFLMPLPQWHRGAPQAGARGAQDEVAGTWTPAPRVGGGLGFARLGWQGP